MNIIRKNLTLAETIAHRNPEIANELLIKNGFPHSPDRDILAKNLSKFLLDQRENALKQLANIHPDKDMLLGFVGADNGDEFQGYNADGENEGPKKRKRKGNCPGCGGQHHNADGDNYSNCCGSHADGDGYSNCSGCGGGCKTKQLSNFSNAAGDEAAAAKRSTAAMLVNRDMLAIVGVIGLFTVALIAISRQSKA